MKTTPTERPGGQIDRPQWAAPLARQVDRGDRDRLEGVATDDSDRPTDPIAIASIDLSE